MWCVVGVLSGCEAGAPKTDCGGAVTTVLKIANAKPDDHTAQVKNAVITQCTNAKWSPEAAHCMKRSQSYDDLQRCRHDHLTGLQNDALEATVAPLFDDTEAVMAVLERFSERMCACKDIECSKQVNDEMAKWSMQAAKARQPPKMSEEQTKRATDIGTRMSECMMKAMQMGGAGRGNGNVPF